MSKLFDDFAQTHPTAAKIFEKYRAIIVDRYPNTIKEPANGSDHVWYYHDAADTEEIVYSETYEPSFLSLATYEMSHDPKTPKLMLVCEADGRMEFREGVPGSRHREVNTIFHPDKDDRYKVTCIRGLRNSAAHGVTLNIDADGKITKDRFWNGWSVSWLEYNFRHNMSMLLKLDWGKLLENALLVTPSLCRNADQKRIHNAQQLVKLD